MRNFFLGSIAVSGDSVAINGELYRHMARVLRLKEGCEVSLTNDAGKRYSGVIEEVGAKELTVRITAEDKATQQEGVRITLYQGMPKGEKLELILQKCTELGVSEVVTFDAARSIVKLSGERSASRLGRYQKIVQEAARQSGRISPPKVSLGGALQQVLRESDHDLKLLLWEGEQTNRLREALGAHDAVESVAVVVGPEGGLTQEEVEQAISCGFTPITLGQRILRTETAGMAMVSILQFHFGDIG